MIVSLSNLLAPHYCSSCGEIGSVLCEYCKYDIIEDRFMNCVVCGNIIADVTNLCKSCHVPFSKAWCVGERHQVLRRLLDDYKFNRRRSNHSVCADLLDDCLPVLPGDTKVTFVTTTPPDVRRRGYDHAQLIAKRFAKIRGLDIEKTIVRPTYRRQFGASKQERINNAAESIRVDKTVQNVPYLLIDDIYTTGATVARASEQLLAAGAREVYVAILARQPLEKSRHI